MMKRTLSTAFAAIALGGVLLAPHASGASPSARTYQLVTRVLERQPGTNAHDGTMRLTVAGDGAITGYYRPRNGRFIQVNGGVDPQGQLWIDIGLRAAAPNHFIGTFHDGSIDATSTTGNLILELIGTPQK